MTGKNQIKSKKRSRRMINFNVAVGKKARSSSVGRYLQSVLDGSVLAGSKNLVSLPYVLFLTGLAMVYISNNYYAQRKIREMNRIETEMKELRFEYRSTNSYLMFESKQSEVARKLEGTGIEESTEPPKKLFTNPKSK